MKSCCVAGHRNISPSQTAAVTPLLRAEIAKAVGDGFTCFYSGLEEGVDTLFAKLVIEAREEHPKICLEIASPYPEWMSGRSQEDKEILAKMNGMTPYSQGKTPDSYLIRNRGMLKECERLIAVYDGRDDGGTAKTMRYAFSLGMDIREIRIDPKHM